MTMKRVASLFVLAIGLHAGVAAGASAGTSASAGASATTSARPPLDAQIDTVLGEGYEHPLAALETLRRFEIKHGHDADSLRRILDAIGAIQATSGDEKSALATADRLLALTALDTSGRSLASSNLMRARIAEQAGQLDLAAALAQLALPALQSPCASPAAPGTTDPVDPALTCDYRSAWRALQTLERHALSVGLPAAAAIHAKAQLALAEAAGDPLRRSVSVGALALLAEASGDHDAAMRLVGDAMRLANRTRSAAQQARILIIESRINTMRHDEAAALSLLEKALSLAATADAKRLEAFLLTSMGDTYARMHRPDQALQAAERALAVTRLYKDVRSERVLLTNIAIAKLGLGRLEEGKQDMAHVLEMWKTSGETGRRTRAMFDFGEALAAAGDARSALELYHAERSLMAELIQANRSVALKDLQARYEADAGQRRIDLVSRDNLLKTEALANRDLQQRLWMVLAGAMLVPVALVSLLYKRVRETNRRLAASQLLLQAQTERDPLTNLANRRHFKAVMTRLCSNGKLNAALLLIDIDHFKRVNDVHGHSAGDQVLVEVAERLNRAVRDDDLVVRWGGEEFLIVAAQATHEQAEAMAARVLTVLAELPIRTGTQTLRITASVGYAAFPIAPLSVDVSWEKALSLIDMALRSAKRHGRNQAVGIRSAHGKEQFDTPEDDFDAAARDGRITLGHTPGPQAGDVLRAA